MLTVLQTGTQSSEGLLISCYLPCLPMLFVYGGNCTTHMKWNLKSFNFLYAVVLLIHAPHIASTLSCVSHCNASGD